MEQLIFKNLPCQKKAWLCRKLSLCEYEIKSNELRVAFEDGVKTIIFHDKEVRTCIRDFANGLEAIYKPLCEMLENYGTGDLIADLGTYKEMEYPYTLGKNVSAPYLCKLFHAEEPQEIEQNGGYGRAWIDLSAQLHDHADHISHDTYMWSSSLALPEMMGQTLLERYGRSMLILRPLELEKYIVLEKEVVGKKFRVLAAGNLDEAETWEKFKSVVPENDFEQAWLNFKKL